MVKLNKIYTRTGDDGTTGLVDGSRVSKADPLMAAIGDVDECNSAIGVARIHFAGSDSFDEMLARIQNDLFDLGADLATPLDGDQSYALRVTPGQAEWLEASIDRMNGALAPLKSFVLPAGEPGAAALHLARAIARRAERSAVVAEARGDVLIYLNRLSDFLFVAARAVNQNGAGEVLWVPGGSR
ncbi:cob(I)yrinic acid a,c-diamide adenosyltransferase [Sphingomonas sp. LB-2]|uniref:cob(I)yrinic acid a,c-diamide adenosyltransferase n=1 Tax=Sphingomonas caeni TaxID=2984949 RepID=UPI00222ED1E5|nr:cob(I)yrinic acid a,c-diamide adenosyltransferase [Sphingomonas caeni]MCW3846362.1 cob(I)yrinic acid a,c-diamide adenosyltransferase [Sphingomonas caeni]